MKTLERLSPAEAIRRWKEDGAEAVYLEISEVLKFMKMRWPELRNELAEGRMTACGKPTGGGYKDIAIRVSELLRWIGTGEGSHYFERRSAH